jgi:hypothetical protein
MGSSRSLLNEGNIGLFYMFSNQLFRRFTMFDINEYSHLDCCSEGRSIKDKTTS